MPSSVDLAAAYAESGVAEVLDQLDQELIGLLPVKTRIREIAADRFIPADKPSRNARDVEEFLKLYGALQGGMTSINGVTHGNVLSTSTNPLGFYPSPTMDATYPWIYIATDASAAIPTGNVVPVSTTKDGW